MDLAGRFYCGMYVLYPPLRDAWRTLWQNARPLLDDCWGRQVDFTALDDALPAESRFIAHTCGYPYRKLWRERVRPLFVAQFDIEHCRGPRYRSLFLVPAGSGLRSLEDCRGKPAAVNHRCSNSGMNVLRHAIAPLAGRQPFISDILWSGSHVASVEAVAEGRASLTSIDCVSYQYLMDHDPGLLKGTRCIGVSKSSMGLPFIAPVDEPRSAGGPLRAFDRALNSLDDAQRKVLRIERFVQVADADYQSIDDLEREAVEAGYGSLR